MYPENIDYFTEKLNKLDNNTYVIEEEVLLKAGVYEGYLEHDNVSVNTVNIYSGKKLTGEKINNFILSTQTKTPWKKSIKIFSDKSPLYITYETQGDTVEADDINVIQESIVNTQKELDGYKSINNIKVNNLKENTVNLENTKASKTYVDTELNKKYNKTEVYTKTEADRRIQEVVGTAPAALDTLKEIADSLNNDADFAGTMVKNLSTKVDKVEGKKLSTEDYTTIEKNKLAGIEAGANKYIHPSGSNPHGTSKSDIGLYNVTNDAQVKRSEMGVASGVATLDSNGVNSQAPKVHAHDDRYYTESEADNKFVSKTELGNAGYGDMIKSIYDTNGDGIVDKADKVEWGGVLNKPSTFNPSSHTHTKSQITDFPTTLPANGGNADTVDNKHATDFMKAGPVTWNNLKGV